MAIPERVLDPPFRITRASHICLDVADLDESRRFYEQVIGLVVTHEEPGHVYLRGIEEACHHSLVLKTTKGAKRCSRIGLRVLTDEDIDRAAEYFRAAGCDAEFVDAPYQGPTLNVTDTQGVPLQLTSRMPTAPRRITNFSGHLGGGALRIDHFQIIVPEVRRALEFYMSMGFWLSEYIGSDDENVLAVFLQRKGNPHDIVFFNGNGPQLHHFAFMTSEGANLLRACDIAGELGYGRGVERGPGRHGPGHALFVYFRDPDGHRVELFNTHYQVMDLENEPVRWNPADSNVSFPWGMPARRNWFEQATEFEGQPVRPASVQPTPYTLEQYLIDGMKFPLVGCRKKLSSTEL